MSLEQTTAARDTALAGRDAARARLAEAERQLKEASLIAPFDGTVLDVRLEAKEMARPGQPVVILSAEDSLEVEVRVPESIRAHLASDTPVEVTWPLADLPAVEGRIERFGRAASGPAGLFAVVVAIDDTEGVSPGFTAEVALPVRMPQALVVPVAAVADPGGDRPFVYRVLKDTAERVPVRVQALIDGGAVVQADLQSGDQVIVRGHASLLPGERIEVAP